MIPLWLSDFQPMAANPGRFGVRYILLGNPAVSGADAVAAAFPGIWDAEGAPVAEVVAEWGDADHPRTNYRLLRIKDVEAETSLSRATIYRRIAEGEFPAPIRLTTQRVAWSQTAIERWKSEQLAACTT